MSKKQELMKRYKCARTKKAAERTLASLKKRYGSSSAEASAYRAKNARHFGGAKRKTAKKKTTAKKRRAPRKRSTSRSKAKSCKRGLSGYVTRKSYNGLKSELAGYKSVIPSLQSVWQILVAAPTIAGAVILIRWIVGKLPAAVVARLGIVPSMSPAQVATVLVGAMPSIAAYFLPKSGVARVAAGIGQAVIVYQLAWYVQQVAAKTVARVPSLPAEGATDEQANAALEAQARQDRLAGLGNAANVRPIGQRSFNPAAMGLPL